jgi:predicted DNA-binding transcriptional regulator YafY
VPDDIDDSHPSRSIEQRQPAPERLRRIWSIVEDIARQPGKSRKQLAAELELSERQVQADLNVIRRHMGLPLVRRHGYRFLGEEQDAASAFSLAEGQLLLMLLRRATRDPSLPTDRLRSLMLKLPYLFPLHLRPLVAKTLEAVDAEGSTRQQEIFAPLADALLRKGYVKLHYPAGHPEMPIAEPIVRPEVLLPYRSSWHVIGHCRQRGRTMVFDLAPVVAVTQASAL